MRRRRPGTTGHLHLARWLIPALLFPAASAQSAVADAAETPVVLGVQVTAELPGVKPADLPRRVSVWMEGAGLKGWRFEPVAPGEHPPPGRVQWEFRLLRVAQERSRSHRHEYPFPYRAVSIRGTLFICGAIRNAVSGDAVIGRRPQEGNVETAVADLTRSLLARSGRYPCPSRQEPAPPGSGGSSPRKTTPSSVADSLWTRDLLTGEWDGLRRRLEERGISIGITALAEGIADFRGGIRTGAIATATPDIGVALDLERLLGLRGGEFYFDLKGHAGRDPSIVLVGDLQEFSKYASAPFVQVYDLWYQQPLFDGTLRIKAGKMDANAEFSVINNGLKFMNSSAQASPTIVGFPTYPNPSAAINLFYTPANPFYASFAVYDVGRNDRFLVFYGHPESVQPSRTGKLIIGETGLTGPQRREIKSDRNLRLGFWGNTGTFRRFDGGTQQGVRGFYAVLDETLWQPTRDRTGQRGLRMFLEYGRTNCAVSTICRHYGGGLAWTGPSRSRPNDLFGFGPQYAPISEKAGSPYPYELAIETFYRIHAVPWLIVQPDLQYIVHPGGKYPSAVAGILFIQVKF